MVAEKRFSLARVASKPNSYHFSMENTKLSIKGFTLVEMMIVVAIIGLLAAIAISNFVRARGASQKSACINNLRKQ